MYTANVEESKKWAAMTKQQRESEINRLQREVSQLELRRESVLKKRKDTTKNSIIGGPRLMMERHEKRVVQTDQLNDIDDQLFAKRRQLDLLRSPSEQGRLASRTTEESQRRQDSAQNSRQSAMYDIDRRLKPKKSVTDIVSEFEDATIGKLTKALSGKVSSLEEDIKALKGKLAAAEDAILQIPVSDISDLRRIKSQLDR